MRKICKRSQQEIIGFVLIVVIVVVVGVIFLGISLRKDRGIARDDAKISNFLSASMKYTTVCAKDSATDYRILSDVIIDTYKGRPCFDGRPAASVLEETYRNITDVIWRAGEAYPIKYYKLSIFYQSNLRDDTTADDPILVLESGNSSICPVRRAGQSIQDYSPGVIITELEICRDEN